MPVSNTLDGMRVFPNPRSDREPTRRCDTVIEVTAALAMIPDSVRVRFMSILMSGNIGERAPVYTWCMKCATVQTARTVYDVRSAIFNTTTL